MVNLIGLYLRRSSKKRKGGTPTVLDNYPTKLFKLQTDYYNQIIKED